jgi:hypothetical protein
MASPAKTSVPPLNECFKYTGGEASVAIAAYLRVKVDSNDMLAIAGAGEDGIGFNIETDRAAGEAVTVRAITAPEHLVVASAAIAVGASVESAANGQVVTQSAGATIGQARTAAGAAGEVIRISTARA